MCDKNGDFFAEIVSLKSLKPRRWGQNGFCDGLKPSFLAWHKATKNGDKDSFSCPYPRRWRLWLKIRLVAGLLLLSYLKVKPETLLAKRQKEADQTRGLAGDATISRPVA